jgi:ATP-binding cassette subfamily B protein
MNIVERDPAPSGQKLPDAVEPAGVAPPPAPAVRSLRPLASLVPYIGRYPWRAGAAVLALLAAAFATLVVPVAIRRMIDFGFSRDSSHLMDNYFSVMIAVVALLAVASAARFYLVSTLGERVIADLREEVFGHLISLSAAYFDLARSGELISRLTADTTQIKAAVSTSVFTALRNLVRVAGAAAMMILTSPRLSAFVLAAIPVIVLPLYAFGRVVRRRSRAAQDTLAAASAYASELIAATRVLQAFTNERLARGRFGSAVEQAFSAARMSIRARALLTAIVIFLVFGSVVIVLWVGAQDVLAARLTAGRLSQFLLYAVLAAAGLGQLSEAWGELFQAAGAAERLFEIVRVPVAIRSPAQPVPLPATRRGEVSFTDVCFSYPARPTMPVLDAVSFDVCPGERLAIVGPSGAGKSTLFHLIMRFYDPSSGSIRFDGISLPSLDLTVLRQHIALVPQEPVVFAASIRDNIRFGRPQASDAEVEHAAEAALAREFIDRLPERFDTEIGERGATLSGGQRQRIAIARAILRDAPLLLLDEATSSLDMQSEMLIRSALEHLMQDRTTLVIAHRLATVLSCNRILVLDRGRIVEEGGHEALSRAGGLYSRLAQLQFQG